jgi:hypothetical protein
MRQPLPINATMSVTQRTILSVGDATAFGTICQDFVNIMWRQILKEDLA